MPLTFHPDPGTILMCDFSAGFHAPEATKNRPVVVISPKQKRSSQLCTVLLISTAQPDPKESWHYLLPKNSMPNTPRYQAKESWVKGDMIYRVSFERLNLIRMGKEPDGSRIYFKQRLGRAQMKDILSCALYSINLGHITQHI